MANKKIKFPLWLMPETKAMVERLYRQDGCSSQSEFMERAIPVSYTHLIGVYIGNGEVVEAMGTRYGVVKTKLEGARWTHWLKIPYISYD